ncbi:MAG: BamA/TamA family outer membrane protein [Myxococcales bacterium]|nr:BamA/TamA family outer membrane protein [Myxococcales bacterium]
MRRAVLLAGLLLWATGARAQAPTADEAQPEQEVVQSVARFDGQTIAEVALVCDIDACRDPRSRRVLRRLLRMDAGESLDKRLVGRAWSKLMRTGYFRTVDVQVEARDEGLDVRFVCDGHIVITELDIDYANVASTLYPKQFAAEIRKRLLLRKGGNFPPRQPDGSYAPADQAFLDRQKQQIVSLYAQQGFVGTTVRIEPTYEGPNGKTVEVRIVVDEGEQPPLGQVLLSGNEARAYAEVVGPITTGERIDFWKPFFRFFGVGTYERRRLKEELDAVEKQYREDGWVSARVRLEPVVQQQGVVFPRVRVYEGPRLEVAFEGNEALDDDELRDVLTFSESGALDDTEIEQSAQAIVDAYQAVAHYYARVDWRAERPAEGAVKVTFTVTEGPRVYVRRIEVWGNQALTRREIIGAMETKGIAEDGVIGAFGVSAGVAQDSRLVNDLTAVRALYHDRGFPAVQFRCAPADADAREWTRMRLLAEQADERSPPMGPPVDATLFAGRFDVWTDAVAQHHCFLVIPDADERLVTVRIQIDEGLQTTVDRLAIEQVIEGMDAKMQDEAYALMQNLGFMDDLRRWKPNAGLNRRKLEAVRGFLLRYFHQQGYLQAEVTPICLGRDAEQGEDAERDCGQGQLYGVHLDAVRFQLEPGPLSRVEGILLRGNLRTRDAVLFDELLLRDGGPLGTEELFLSQANLRSLGVFQAVNVETIGDPPALAERADERRSTVLVSVEESRYQYIEAYGGLQLDSAPLSDSELPVQYLGGLILRDRNLAGRALELGAGFNHANRIDTPQDVQGDDAVWEAGPFFKDRRLFGTRLDLTIDAAYTRSRTAERDAYEEVVNAKVTVGYDFHNLSYPADWGRGLRTTLATEYRRERRRALTRSGERPPFGAPSHSVGVEPAVIYDRRDNPLHPTRGYLVTASALIVFNDAGAVTDLTLPAFKETVTGQYVQSFFKRRLIIVPTLRLGALQTDDTEDDLPSGFFFKAGGDAVTLPVRGYEDASIDACNGRLGRGACAGVYAEDDDELNDPLPIGGKAMMVGSLEARFPTFLIDDFWWAVFGDAGAVAPSWAQMNVDRIYPSAGVGLRWLVTGQIPLRLDLAWPLRDTGFAEASPRLHLNIFYTL